MLDGRAPGLLAGRQVDRLSLDAAAAQGLEADAAAAARVRPGHRHLADPGRRRRGRSRWPARTSPTAACSTMASTAASPSRPTARSSSSSPTTASDPRTPEEIAADVEIVRPDQGEGYTGYGPAQVWVAAPRRRSPSKFAAAADRAPDQRRRLVRRSAMVARRQDASSSHANKTDDRESVRYSINKNFDLWLIDVADQEADASSPTGPGPDVSPRFSPDGKQHRLPEHPAQGLAPRCLQPGRRRRSAKASRRCASCSTITPRRRQAAAPAAVVPAAGRLLGRHGPPRLQRDAGTAANRAT